LRTALGHPFATMFAHGLTARAALGGADEAIMIAVKTDEGLLGAGLDVGDDDRAARFHPGHAAVAAGWTAMGPHRTGAPVGAGFAPRLADSVELGPADSAVIIRVQPVEAGLGAGGPAGLHGGAALVGCDRTIVVNVDGGQALHALADEFGLAETAVAVDVSAHGVRRLLGEGDAGGGERERGQSADEKGLVHH